MKPEKRVIVLIVILYSFCGYTQNRYVINNNAYTVITNSANLVIDNPNTNGITTISSGNIISEGEFNVVKWNIGTGTGNYIVPFTTASLVKIPLQLTINTAGAGAGSGIVFSTYKTATNANIPYPSDVTNMNSNCNTGNALYAVDRFWRIDAGSYTTKPTPLINFAYNNAASEIGGSNTITVSRLKAERFNNSINSWETPQKLYGIDNPVLNTVSGVSVAPVDFYKSWTLIDTVIMTIPIGVSLSSNSICAGNTSVINPSGASTYTLMPSNISGTSFTVTPGTNTTYTIIGTNAAGCVSAPSSGAIATVTVNPLPTYSLSANAYTICTGSSQTFSVSGASSYTWTPAGSLSNPNIANPAANPGTTTVYSVTGTNSSGCSNLTSPATVTLTVNSLPTITVVPTSTSICSGGGSATLTASGANTYTWTSATTLNAPTGSVVVATPTNTAAITVYTVSGTNINTCVNTTTVGITVNPTPTVSVSGGGGANSQAVCGGGLANNTVAGIIFSVNPPGSVSWTNNNTAIGLGSSGIGNINAYPAPTVSVQTTGVITVNATSVNGCTSTSGSNLTYTITINPLPGLTTPTITSAGCGQNNGTITGATGTGGSGNYSYAWLPASFGSSSSYTNAAGTYTLHTQDNVTGCVNSQNFTIPNSSAPPSPSVTLSSTVACAGGSVVLSAPVSAGITYSWTESNGNTGTGNTYTVNNMPASPNPYLVTVTSTSMGCTSMGNTSSITVNPLPVPTISNSGLQICQGSHVTLSANPTGAYSYQWSNAGGFITGATHDTLSINATGVYSVTVTNTITTCSATAYANETLTVNSLPVINTASAITVSSNCNTLSGSITNVMISGSPAYTYTWTNGTALPTGAVVASGTGSIANLLNVSAGAYCLNVTDGNGCAANFCSLTINNIPAPAEPNLVAGNDTVYCSGASPQTLTVSVSGTVTPTVNWYSNAALTNTLAINSTTYTPVGLPVGTTTLYVTSTVGACSSTVRPITITINPAPSPPVLSGTGTNSITECQGASPTTLSLTTTASVTPVWYVGTTAVATGTTYAPGTSTPGTTVYSLSDSSTVTGCTNLLAGNALTFTVTVHQSPTLNISGLSIDTANCGQSTGSVNGIVVTGGTPGYTYQWYYYPGGAAVANATSPVLSNQPAGTYSLQVTDANGCVAGGAGGTTIFSVPASSTVEASFITNPGTATGSIPLDIVFTNNSTGATSYTWTFGDGNVSHAVSPANTYTSVGTYTVMLVAVNGNCKDTATAIIMAEIPATVVIPNVFSPNGDGVNDQFFIINTRVSSLHCDIFNRWGQLLFTISTPNQSWDGKTPDGNNAPDGTYMYIFSAKDMDGKTYQQNGTITLVR